jgi:replication-associated recombination protein RarA
MAGRQRAPGRSFPDLVTPGGYRCDEVVSALQKSVRRGLERESLYWATELDLAGFADYLWRRLRIIASEDVGVAAPEVAVQVRALSENFADQRRHNAKSKTGSRSGERLFIVQAVILLVRAPKSRMIDHCVMALYEGERPAIEIPDFAIDMHTRRGRALGRGADHFFDVGALLAGEALPDTYAEEGRAARSRETKRPDAAGGQLELADD